MKISERKILCSNDNQDWYNRELAYRKNNYLRAKRAFETLSEDDNNDVLTLEDKMLAAKANYENFIALLEEDVLDYVMSNPEAFSVKSEDSRNYKSATLNEIEERSRSFEFDVDTSGEDLTMFVDNGYISWSDFEYWLGDLTNYYGGRVSSWARDGFTIVDLNQEEYEEWEEMYEKELMSYIDELREEYGDEGEDY